MKKVFYILFTFLFIPSVLATDITLDEIAKHNTLSDCYLVIEGKVYDVTSYVNDHPGGKEMLLIGCGKDATSLYNTKGGEGRGHSMFARDLLQTYYVADVGTASVPLTNSNDSSKNQNENTTMTVPVYSNNSSFMIPSVFDQYPYIIPVTIIWFLLFLTHGILRKLQPKPFNRFGLLRITSFLMILCFTGTASGGIYMIINGRREVFGFDPIYYHVFFGYCFVLVALMHIFLHRKDLWLYLKRAFAKK